MRKGDIEKVDKDMQNRDGPIAPWAAWQRIKKDLQGSGQNSAEKTQPCGEHNTSSPKLPEFEILNQAYDTYSQQQTGHRSTEDEIDILKFAHKFIAGKIGR